MKRFFINYNNNSLVEVEQDEVQHMSKVLRMSIGDNFMGICDDEFEYLCSITNIEKNKISAKILNKQLCEANPKSHLVLFQGVAKGEKNHFITQKATELGVEEIVFFESKFTVARADNSKLEKLKKVAKEACKQCGRSLVPKISLTKFNLLKDKLINFDLILFLYEKEFVNNSLNKYLKDIQNSNKIAVIVGAEGGFSSEECEFMENLQNQLNINSVSLGKRILRTETTSIAMCSFISFLKNN